VRRGYVTTEGVAIPQNKPRPAGWSLGIGLDRLKLFRKPLVLLLLLGGAVGFPFAP